MKCIWKRLAIITLMFVLSIIAVPVSAKAAVSVPQKIELTLYPKNDAYKDIAYTGATCTYHLNSAYLGGSTKKVTNLKSSKPSVATISQRKVGYLYGIYVNVKKAGTTTVSFRENSKTYRVKVTVKKYVNAISSVKIGTTTLSSSKFKLHAVVNSSYSKFAKKKAKISIKLRQGWKLTSNYFWYFRKGWTKYSDPCKNGKTITIKGGSGFAIFFQATNTSTGQIETYHIQLK